MKKQKTYRNGKVYCTAYSKVDDLISLYHDIFNRHGFGVCEESRNQVLCGDLCDSPSLESGTVGMKLVVCEMA